MLGLILLVIGIAAASGHLSFGQFSNLNLPFGQSSNLNGTWYAAIGTGNFKMNINNTQVSLDSYSDGHMTAQCTLDAQNNTFVLNSESSNLATFLMLTNYFGGGSAGFGMEINKYKLSNDALIEYSSDNSQTITWYRDTSITGQEIANSFNSEKQSNSSQSSSSGT